MNYFDERLNAEIEENIIKNFTSEMIIERLFNEHLNDEVKEIFDKAGMKFTDDMEPAELAEMSKNNGEVLKELRATLKEYIIECDSDGYFDNDEKVNDFFVNAIAELNNNDFKKTWDIYVKEVGEKEAGKIIDSEYLSEFGFKDIAEERWPVAEGDLGEYILQHTEKFMDIPLINKWITDNAPFMLKEENKKSYPADKKDMFKKNVLKSAVSR